ncbi:prepilin-type N-terminal cleavage/methylation domain-containing protein [Rickettsiales bacterium]|nr:prepilin-type N-terminal cleavage/methylation domain-containing protein [Rickettsiales bacterium]
MLNNKIPRSKSAFTLIELSIVLIIIGLLVGGVTGASSLIYSAKLKSARMMSKSSAVITSEDLVLWLDATAKDAYSEVEGLSDESDVTTFKNVSPQSSGGDLTQLIASLKPHYLKSGINGLPAVKFTGGSGQNMLSNQFSSTVQNKDFTIFAVFKFDETVAESSGGFIKFISEDSNLGGAPVLSTSIYKSVVYNFAAGSGGNANAITGYSYNDRLPALVTIKYDFVLDKANIDIDIDNKKFANNTSFSNFFASGSAANKLSYLHLLANNEEDFKIGEIALYSRKLHDDEINNIKKYLVKKWGI